MEHFFEENALFRLFIKKVNDGALNCNGKFEYLLSFLMHNILLIILPQNVNIVELVLQNSTALLSAKLVL